MTPGRDNLNATILTNSQQGITSNGNWTASAVDTVTGTFSGASTTATVINISQGVTLSFCRTHGFTGFGWLGCPINGCPTQHSPDTRNITYSLIEGLGGGRIRAGTPPNTVEFSDVRNLRLVGGGSG
jgi:hypothetical protein